MPKPPYYRVTVEFVPDIEADPDLFRLHWSRTFVGKTLAKVIKKIKQRCLRKKR